MTLLSGAIGVLATWLLLVACFTGVGLLAWRFVGLRELHAERLLGAFWVGLSLTVLYLLAWSLVLPVGHTSVLVPMAAGAAGIALHVPELADWKRDTNWRSFAPYLAAIVVVGVWIAVRAMGPPSAYETGSYHLPVVLWAKTFPAVPGLTNLHGRMGFNNANLLLAALVDRGPWERRSPHLVSGLLLFVLAVQIVLGLSRLFRRDRDRIRTAAFDVMLLFPLVALVRQPDSVSSLRPDLATAVALFVATRHLLVLASADREERASDEGVHAFLVATVLLALAVAFKLSAAAYAGVGFLLALAWWWGVPGPRARRSLRTTLAISVAFGGLWTARGVVTSGYPAYPSTFGGLPVEWRAPVEQARAEGAWVEHFGRYYYASEVAASLPYRAGAAAGWRWVRRWAGSLVSHPDSRWRVAAPALASGVLALFALLARVAGRRVAAPDRSWWLIAPLTAGTLLWFLAGPRPTFGYFLFWLFAAWAASVVAGELLPERRFAVAAGAAVLFGIWPALRPVVDAALDPSESVLEGAALVFALEPGPDDGFHPAPRVGLSPFETLSGLTLYVPTDGENQCWWSELLCTPHPAPNLRARDPDDLGRGFAVEGDWEPLRWPHPSSDFLRSWRSYQGVRTGR